jgi:aldehyde dehydrogenase (NAD+)
MAKSLAQVADGNAEDVDHAVEAARGALADWVAHRRPRARALPVRMARHIQKHSRLFAVLESLDNGKPIREIARH